MRGRWLILTVLMAGGLAFAGCAGNGDFVDVKDYTFQAMGPVGIPAHFYDNDQSLRQWYAMPYINPN